MKLSEYQICALETDRTWLLSDSKADSAVLVSLLGLAGEAGELLTEYKKRQRDGPGHERFVDRVAEELGDILWYVANLASKYDLNLDEIAKANLRKTRDRYLALQQTRAFDSDYKDGERFPRRFTVTFIEFKEGGRTEVRAYLEGDPVGAALTDNAYDPDGYRFHDVFHMAYAAVLGWSPVLRKIMTRKRRSNPKVDEVEDGGRAAVIDEGICALVFDYARQHHFLQGILELDDQLLRTVRGMCAHLEVGGQPAALWREAIVQGFAVWREVVRHHGGRVEADLDARRLVFLGPADKPMTTAPAVVSA
jgi:NTP pyrophosphatase (non-canonical NTP hydrolase)